MLCDTPVPEGMLKIFCWVCFTRRAFVLPRQSTLALCSSCGNPEGAMRPLLPHEMADKGLAQETEEDSNLLLEAV